MLLTIASALVFTEISSMLTRKSDLPENGKDFWNRFELRALVILSLSMHVVLIGLGYGKNKKGKAWIQYLTWISYHAGDWVATVSLTTLLKRPKVEINAVEVLWAPFLLLHLGSAETLAAHFINEDELWIRYFIGILIQSAIACYAYWKVHTNSAASTFTANLIFISGIIKCLERIWILRSSSFTQLRNSVISASRPQGSAFMADGKSSRKNMSKPKKLTEYLAEKKIIEEGRYLHGAYLSFKMFLPLFGDCKLGIYRNLSNIFTLDLMSTKEAFKLIGTELGFLFDVLYTKTTLPNSVPGLILRSIFLLFSCLAFIVFSLIISKHEYSYIDITITYLLLFGAIFADLCGLIAHIFSKWTVRRLTKYNNSDLPKCFNKVVGCWLNRMGRKGVKHMAQHSLLEYCLKTKVNKFAAVVKIIGIANLIEKLQFDKWMKVDNELKDFIFCHLKQKRKKYEEEKFELTSHFRLLENGAYELLKRKKVDAELGWSIQEKEFTHSLLLWHIATDILYFDHSRRYPSASLNPHGRISKLLSDYMMHLLVRRPSMLHMGIGELRYRDTFLEARTFLKEMRIGRTELAATTLVSLDVHCRVFLPLVEGELQNSSEKSVFFNGCKLAKELQSLLIYKIEEKGDESKDDKSEDDMFWDIEDVWEMIKTVWVEMMVSAAYNCHWKEHAKQLGHGGELLTHVALLMAHLGLSKHIWMTDLPSEVDQLENYNPPWDWENLDQLAYYLA